MNTADWLPYGTHDEPRCGLDDSVSLDIYCDWAGGLTGTGELVDALLDAGAECQGRLEMEAFVTPRHLFKIGWTDSEIADDMCFHWECTEEEALSHVQALRAQYESECHENGTALVIPDRVYPTAPGREQS